MGRRRASGKARTRRRRRPREVPREHDAWKVAVQSQLTDRQSPEKTGSGCHVVTEPAVATRLRADDNFRVPDLGVTCAAIEAGQIFLPEPLLLIEVLSPGNANDTWENVRAYALIPTVVEMLIVHSTRAQAEVMRRMEDGAWPENAEVIGKGQSVRLLSIGAKIPIAEIYAGTYLA